MTNTIVKINDDSLELHILHDPKYLTALGDFLLLSGLEGCLFVEPTHVGGIFRVLAPQCQIVEALRGLHADWWAGRTLVDAKRIEVPRGVYCKDDDWFVDASIGFWKHIENSVGPDHSLSELARTSVSIGKSNMSNIQPVDARGLVLKSLRNTD